ncbi:MAG: hypothetical protein M1400_01170, partial [Patescibacteria group bacterium]|nr:hypothetical protein [Patescibacteria group bacterium]
CFLLLAVATGTQTITFTPYTVGRYHIRAGRVTISPLVVTDRYGAFLINGSVDLSRGAVSSADATARTRAQQAATKADAAMNRVTTTEKSVGTLSDQIKAIAAAHDQLEQRVSALESRPAPRVDLAPLEQRVASLEAELARVKATANTALSTAQQADAKATDANTRYEEMGLARFKTGLFRSKTVVEAVEDAKAKAAKQ